MSTNKQTDTPWIIRVFGKKKTTEGKIYDTDNSQNIELYKQKINMKKITNIMRTYKKERYNRILEHIKTI